MADHELAQYEKRQVVAEQQLAQAIAKLEALEKVSFV